jgi:Ca2+/Na+ antiporter
MAMLLTVLPVLHAGRFSWDEAIVLIVAILAVPALSWFTGRLGQRREERENPTPRPRHPGGARPTKRGGRR